MKLLLCKYCFDVINLRSKSRSCECNALSGRYINRKLIEIHGDPESFLVIGFNNSNIIEAINSDNRNFNSNITSFIIPHSSPSISLKT